MTKPGSSSPHGTETSEATKEQKEPSPSCGDQKVILLPCRSAPSRERVQIWLQARRQFEQLQRQRRAAVAQEMTELTRDRTPQTAEVVPSDGANSETEPIRIERTSPLRVVRKRGLNLSIRRSQHHALESGSPSRDVKLEKDRCSKDEHDDCDSSEQSISPDSPMLPPWQRTVLPSSTPRGYETEQIEIKRTSPSLSPGDLHDEDDISPEKRPQKEFLSPSPLLAKSMDEDEPNPYLLHSTPVTSRRRSSKVETTSTCTSSPPMTEGRRAAFGFCSTHCTSPLVTESPRTL